MTKHTFNLRLNEAVTKKSEKSKLESSIINGLLYSDEFTFGRNLTTSKPVIVINKQNIKVSLELFEKRSQQLLTRAKKKLVKYLHTYYGYEINKNKKSNKTKNIKSKKLPKTGKLRKPVKTRKIKR